MKNQAEDLTAYRELLEQVYQYPVEIPHKFIGQNTETFRNSVAELESTHSPHLHTRTERTSASNRHLSVSFRFKATSSEAIIDLMLKTRALPEILWVL